MIAIAKKFIEFVQLVNDVVNFVHMVNNIIISCLPLGLSFAAVHAEIFG